jgi:hypothetical protein
VIDIYLFMFPRASVRTGTCQLGHFMYQRGITIICLDNYFKALNIIVLVIQNVNTFYRIHRSLEKKSLIIPK